MIIVSGEIIRLVQEHAELDYPDECGGMLIGRFFRDGRKEIVGTFPVENAREDSRHNRVLILPGDVLRAERYARERKLDVVGYYHSHPDHSAVPSQYDLDHALPVWSYVIVSVLKGKAADVRSWYMENDRSRFNEEEIIADDEGKGTNALI